MIEKKQTSGGNWLSVIMLLIILGILVTMGYYMFMEPETLGFSGIDAAQKKILMNGKSAELKSIAPEQMNTRLYFATAGMESLSAEDRGISKYPNIQEYTRAIIRQLIKGPVNKDLYRTIPAGTTLRAVYVSGETLIVDFSKDIVTQHPGGVSAELLTVYSIVNSLAEVPAANNKSIKNIQILVNGYVIKNLAGHVNVEKPLAPENSLVSSI